MALTAGSSSGHRREYPDRAAFDVTSKTVSVWVNYGTAAANLRIVARAVLGTNGAWSMGVSGSTKHFFSGTSGGATSTAASATGPTAGTWYHYIGTWENGVGSKFYLNGTSDGSAVNAVAPAALADPIYLFEQSGGTPNHANCTLAHFGFWGVVLSADERAALAAGAHPATIRPTSLIECDELHLASVGMFGGDPTDTGANLANASGPPNLKYISKAPRRGRKEASTGAQTVALGRASSTETSRAITVSTALETAITRASEADSARALTPSSALAQAVGRASETDESRTLTVSAAIAAALARASETDAARALTSSLAFSTAVGRASESDEARALTVAATLAVAIARATETDVSRGLTAALALAIGVGRASESDQARGLVQPQDVAIGRASETGEARGLGVDARPPPSAGGNGDPMRRRLVKVRERELVPAAPVDMLFPVALLCMLEADCLY